MSGVLRERVLALAGICQAVRLVQDIARTGTADTEALETSINSIYELDPESVDAVYGEVPSSLRVGLNTVRLVFAGTAKQIKELELLRYMISLMVLEKKLSRNSRSLESLRSGIEQAKIKAEHFPSLHENVVSGLADLYVNTISKLGPRVMVQGEPRHLSNDVNAARIRVLLLAAIRSAVLWRQKGGSRWQLVINRANFVDTANAILREA